MLSPHARLALHAALVLPFLTGCASDPGLFVDLAEERDLEYISYSGDNNWYLIDTLGAGLAAGDLDGDGRPDLFHLTGSAITKRHQADADRHANALWINTGAGFEDVTARTALGQKGWSNGATLADHDGDGDLDIYIARHGPNQLWRNDGNLEFTEVAAESGVNQGDWGLASAFADLDGDGDLDLYVTNYGEFDIEEQADTVNWFTVKQFPHYFPPTDNVLYRNDGNGRFTDITATAGPGGVGGTGRSMAVLAADFDGDVDIDLFVANDIGFNDLYRNDGGMRFTNVAVESGVACDAEGRFQATMGAACGDYDGDGDLDIAVTNYGGEYHTFYRNDSLPGQMLFTDITFQAGLVSRSTLDTVGWGVGLHDLDLDGHLDLLSVNGHVVEGIAHSSLRRPWWLPDWLVGIEEDLEELSAYPQMMPAAFNLPADQPKHLFLGDGQGGFTDASEQAGGLITETRMSRGAAFADFDDDGRMDLAVSNKNQASQVLLNRFPRRGRYLKVRLAQEGANRFAVGARVRARVAPDRELTRFLLAGTSYCSSDDYALHFGLGEVEQVERLEVRWPDGEIETHTGLDVDASYLLERGQPPRRLPGPSGASAPGLTRLLSPPPAGIAERSRPPEPRQP